MKCAYSEKDIALYVEGDLGASGLREAEAHLAGCGRCHALAQELGESQSMLRSLRQDVVSSAVLAGVRYRVLAEIAGAESPATWVRRLERIVFLGFRRGYALAGVGLCVLVTFGIWYAIRAPSVPEAPRLAAVSKPPVIEVSVPEKVAPVRRGRRSPASKPVEEPQQIVVKLFTDDPNVVIYWLVEPKGGDE